MKVGVDPGLCQGHARCEAMSSVLTLDDEGYSNIGPAKDVPAGAEDDVRQGILACPENALREVE